MSSALRAVLALTLACCASPPPPTAAPAPEVPVPVATVVASAAPSAPAPSASAAPPPSSPPASAGSFQQLTEDESRRLVTPHLAGAKLAHPAFRGPFGPSSASIVAVTATADAPPADFAGLVVLPDGKVLKLPALHDHWSGWEVHAVLFEDVDGDGAKELIVIAEYVTGIGPEGAIPFFYNSVVRWDGSAFVRVPAVEKRLERATDAAGVRKVLRARAPRGH
jgi:hypothetical protein